ncbi:MAG: ferric reductase-like transmembrane domain-containing protein [Actinomycetia bacterium]|nr:ferric reductase-like transmembrane domain-containing protein [Actinomycetes bacterium]
MKSIRGIMLIAVSLGITLVLWATATPTVPITVLDHLREAMGGLALNGLALCFVLATKTPVIEKWFGGLGQVYVYHKWLAISSAALLVVHGIMVEVIALVDGPSPETISGQIGALALFLIVAIGLVTIYNKKLPYERWRTIHRFMILAFAIGLYHGYASAKFNLFALSPLSVWMGLTALIGLGCAVYVVFFYRRTQFKYEGRITGITRLSPDVVELDVSLAQPIEYAEGQYAFLRVFQEGLEDAPHPFSMSAGDGRNVRFTIKKSGDFTKDLYESLAPDAPVALEGPHGQMDFRHGGRNQVWIAGGIGITPFMAYLAQNEIDHDVELFYSYRDPNAGIYHDFLAEYEKRNPHFTAHLVDASVDGMLDFSEYTLDEDASIFMCGPPPMMKAYVKFFKDKYGNVNINHEGFAFR